MKEYLTPENHNASSHYHNPYTVSGARSILRRFNHETIAMLDHMFLNHERYDEGKTMLATSPLRSRPYVAAAMKTLGLVEERPTASGACALILTEKALRQLEDLRKYL